MWLSLWGHLPLQGGIFSVPGHQGPSYSVNVFKCMATKGWQMNISMWQDYYILQAGRWNFQKDVLSNKYNRVGKFWTLYAPKLQKPRFEVLQKTPLVMATKLRAILNWQVGVKSMKASITILVKTTSEIMPHNIQASSVSINHRLRKT